MVLDEMSDFEINKRAIELKKFLSDISGSEISIISYPLEIKKQLQKKLLKLQIIHMNWMF